MENIEKVENIKHILQKLKKSFEKDRNRHKKLALLLKLSIAVMSAMAVIFLGWQDDNSQKIFQNLALVLNATITVIVAVEVFYKPQKLWVRETEAFLQFKDIERDLEYQLSGNDLSNEKLDEFKSRIDSVLTSSMEEWISDKKMGN